MHPRTAAALPLWTVIIIIIIIIIIIEMTIIIIWNQNNAIIKYIIKKQLQVYTHNRLTQQYNNNITHYITINYTI